MSNEFVDVLNTETGQRGRIRRNLFNSPVFNPDGLLVEVDSTQKPYVPELYKSKRGEEKNKPEDAEADEAVAEEED